MKADILIIAGIIIACIGIFTPGLTLFTVSMSLIGGIITGWGLGMKRYIERDA